MKKSTLGFTILEVLIATMIFTVILLVCVTGVTRIGQLYYKGVTSSEIQELTRQLSDEFSQQIQFGSRIPIPDEIKGGNPNSPVIFCVGDNRYRAVMNRKLGDSGVATILQRKPYNGECSLEDTGFDGATELAVKNMRIQKLSIIRKSSPSDYVWSLDIRLALGDDDLFTYPTGSQEDPNVYGEAVCKSGISGAQFCATSELQSTLLRRVKID